ncbi:MAG: hypothetical protein EOO04_31060, partial [Chitinophagaceae bacterium]
LSTLTIFRNQSSNGTIAFAPKVQYQHSNDSEKLEITDLNGDGIPDIAVTSQSDNLSPAKGFFSVYENNSSPGLIALKPKVDFKSEYGCYDITVGDFNRDTKPDVVTLSSGVNKITVFTNRLGKQAQTISFSPVAQKTFGDTPFKLTASATSNLPVSFRIISGPGIIQTDTLTVTGAGTIIVEAYQTGDATYYPATIQQSIIVNKASQTIFFDSISAKTFGDPDFFLNAQASSNFPITYSVISGYASISNNKVSIKGAGSLTLRATQPGNQNYLPVFAERTICMLPVKADTIFGFAQTCASAQRYYITKVDGTNYRWEISSGGTLSSPSGDTVTVTWNTLGTHTLTAYAAACGTEQPKSLNVTVTAPLIPSTPRNLFPAAGTIVKTYPVALSWAPSSNTLSYDLYIWPDSVSAPLSPQVTNLTQIGYAVDPKMLIGLRPGQRYNWKVVAKNACNQSASPVNYFLINDLPNLFVQNVQSPANPFSSTPIQLSWQVKNIGKATTGQATWFDQVYLSKDSILDLAPRPGLDFADLNLGGKQNVSALDMNETYTNSITVNLPDSVSGKYYFIIVTSAKKAFAEESFDDNTAFSSSQIVLTPPADLQVTSVVTPEDAFSGKDLMITYTVKNKGTGSTKVSVWKDDIYLSQDPIFDYSTAIKIGEVDHGYNYASTV